MDNQQTKYYESLEKWYRDQTNKRRIQGIGIALGLGACYAVNTTLLGVACITTVVLFAGKLISTKKK